MSFELFESQETRTRFDLAMWDVSNEIGDLPLPAKFTRKELPEKAVEKQKDGHEDKDAQVFALQQRAIGEFLIDREAGTPRVRGYPEFLEDEIEIMAVLKDSLPPSLQHRAYDGGADHLFVRHGQK